MTTVVLGSSGFLGKQLHNYLSKNEASTPLEAVYERFETEAGIKKTLKVLKPKLIYNCIALTNAKKCEDSKEEAFWTNGRIPGIIAEFCRESDAKLIHISTDAVMDTSKAFKCELEEPKAFSIYGESKLEGEKRVQEANCKHAIARVNFFGLSHKGDSLLDFFINNIRNRRECSGYVNVFFNPLGVGTLLNLLYKIQKANFEGIIHVVGNERISKYDFGKEIELRISQGNTLVRAKEVDLENRNQIRDLTLCNCKMQKLFGALKVEWKQELGSFLSA